MTLTSVVLAILLPLAAVSQQSGANAREESAICLSSNLSRATTAARYRAIRVIEDRGTHQRWVLLQDMAHPAAPARLFPGSSEVSGARLHPEGFESHFPASPQNVLLPVIHAGDSLVLSEHTRVADAELEATALATAAIGQSLTVRLRFGGRSLTAIATAPGRAVLSEAGREATR